MHRNPTDRSIWQPRYYRQVNRYEEKEPENASIKKIAAIVSCCFQTESLIHVAEELSPAKINTK